MPTRYRERLKDQAGGLLIATVHRTDRCLLIYPMPEWLETEKRLMDMPSLDPANRRFQALMVGRAADLEMDAQGRVLIPASLREYAHLNRDAVLVGQANRFELWDEAQWKARCDQWLKVDETAEPLSPELKALKL